MPKAVRNIGASVRARLRNIAADRNQPFELLLTRMVTTPEFRFARPLVGFETFARGELIATDGDEELRAPCDECTVLMPTRRPIVGREGVYLARPIQAQA